MIRDQEVFTILKNCEIMYGAKDLTTIEHYLRHFKSKEQNAINFRAFLDHFRIKRDTSELLNHIINQLIKNKVNLDDVTVQKRLDINDFKGVMLRANVKIEAHKI